MIDAVLASGNRGKAEELTRLLHPLVRVSPLPAGISLPEETGTTFLENARLKAEAAFQALGGRAAVLADDSGLEVDALQGQPGVMSARYAGEKARDEDNVQRLLAALRGRSDRSARFVCELVLLLPASASAAPLWLRARGTLEGEIGQEPRGGNGFGYDPVFIPRGWSHTIAECSSQEKDAVSHRGAAARDLLAQLAPLAGKSL